MHCLSKTICINGIWNPTRLKVSITIKGIDINGIYKFWCLASIAFLFFLFLVLKKHIWNFFLSPFDVITLWNLLNSVSIPAVTAFLPQAIAIIEDLSDII